MSLVVAIEIILALSDDPSSWLESFLWSAIILLPLGIKYVVLAIAYIRCASAQPKVPLFATYIKLLVAVAVLDTAIVMLLNLLGDGIGGLWTAIAYGILSVSIAPVALGMLARNIFSQQPRASKKPPAKKRDDLRL